jgi:hypothetical protein
VPPDPRREICVVFDFLYEPRRAYAEIGTRMRVRDVVTGSLPSDGEAGNAFAPANWDAPADRLDFALLKLVSATPSLASGGRRGHYELFEAEYDFAATRSYLLMHHALGNPLNIAELNGAPQVSAPGATRVRYGGNTLPGSSGSAIVDRRGRLVALHHYSDGKRNQGVPIAKIAKVLLGGEYAGLFSGGVPVPASITVAGDNPFEANTVLGRPFANRTPLRSTMSEMALQTNVARTLAITGRSGTGVSYSYKLASHMADQSTLYAPLRKAVPGGVKTVRIDLRSYVNVGVDEVRTQIGIKLLMELGIIETPTDALAQEARETIRLIDLVGPRLRRLEQQWWFFFDSIDNLFAVKQGEVDELIHALIQLTDDAPLRVVIAGSAADQFADEHATWAATDSVSGLTRGDAEQWLDRRASEQSLQLDKAQLAAKLDELFPAPGAVPEPRVVETRLLRLLNEVRK